MSDDQNREYWRLGEVLRDAIERHPYTAPDCLGRMPLVADWTADLAAAVAQAVAGQRLADDNTALMELVLAQDQLLGACRVDDRAGGATALARVEAARAKLTDAGTATGAGGDDEGAA